MCFSRLESALGHAFEQQDFLVQALTHRSYGQPNNERLEFLGDSVLNCVTAIALFHRFGGLREGELSRLRASLVRQETLHQLALDLDLGSFLRLGEGELKGGGASRPSILSDALEAVFAAVFLDAGFEAAKVVIDGLYAPQLDKLNPASAVKDPKTALQEWLQARHLSLPRYAVVGVTGEAHAQAFEVECTVAELSLSTHGQGQSRRIAEQQAAQRALASLEKR